MEKLAAQEGIDYAEYLLDSTRRLKNLSSRRTRRCRGSSSPFSQQKKRDGFVEPSSMSMVVRTKVCKPNGHSASNAVNNPCDRDVLDAASLGWTYH